MLCEKMTEVRGEEFLPRRVTFVCTGNTCRSPMAAAVANALAVAREGDAPRVIATSAGLYANDGEPITPHAVEALERASVRSVAGLDYHLHTAHTVSDADVEAAELLIAVSPSHAMELLFRFPAAANKIACLPKPISDPYGGDLARYEACLSEITACVRALLFGEEPT